MPGGLIIKGIWNPIQSIPPCNDILQEDTPLFEKASIDEFYIE